MLVTAATVVSTHSNRNSPSPDQRSVQVVAIKPLMQGLIDRDGLAAGPPRSAVRNFVVNVGWAEMQPEPDGPITIGNPIDQAIVDARQAAMADGGVQVRVKVRLLSGVQAPEWVKHLDGPPVALWEMGGGRFRTIGRFWSEGFGLAYRDLQERLAARYDTVPEVAEVTASRCTTIYAEPFLRQAGDPGSVQALLDAGYSAEADARCLREQIEAHGPWRLTRTSVSFNPYQEILADGTSSVDDELTEHIMGYCRQVLGPRCVLENNSIRWPPLGNAYTAMYADMARFGPPLTFQTAAPDRIGDWRRTLGWAVEQGANAVELNMAYSSYPLAELAQFRAELEANPVP